MLVFIFLILPMGAEEKKNEAVFGLVIHGGAGTILKKNMTTAKEMEYRQKLKEALQAGYTVLKNGGSSLDAVEKVIRIMEDSPLFNAGKGAVFTADGKHELDASIMDGKTLNAGSVAGVRHVRNPISLARKVMEVSPHVMLTGEGAERFALKQKFQLVDQQYFYTRRRWQSLQRIKKRQKGQNRPSPVAFGPVDKRAHWGTVGAAALDKMGNLAAGTSTGGMTNKRYGRVGDSPIIGAGTYANNNTCAVSATGHGEFFIRRVVCYDISALMEYKGLPLKEAAEQVVMEKLVKMKGTGGVIAIDSKGNVAMPFNTSGMYRGFVREDGKIVTKIYRE
jgi:beta-aspartyl-peptidase (threonine type)